MKTAIASVVAALLLVVGVAVGGWHLGWWIKEETVNRNAEIFQDSYGRQNAIVEAILNDFDDANNPALPAAQRIAITDRICHNAALLTGTIQLPSTINIFIAKECP